MNIVIYTLVILSIFYLLLKKFTTISSKKISKNTRILMIISLFLLMLALAFLRFYDDFSPNTKYSPPKYENGKLVPAENK